MSGPRILAIMGSGETAPTMAKVHASLLERFGATPVVGAVIDTPYGFQENADDLTERMVAFFRERTGRPFSVASYRSRLVDAATEATAVARIREADYVMTGPGSPSYALRHWKDGPIPSALASKLASGGIVTMASAAALTLGVATIPVYEIYKVGEDPRWLEGLDLLGPATGLRAAVVPHYDNAEGGNHDTRFCYVGERRLQILERLLPPDVFVLGVDGHTALIFDLETGTALVRGQGGVTVRVMGRSTFFPNGTAMAIGALGEAAGRLSAGESSTTPGAADPGVWLDTRDGAPSYVAAGGRPDGPLPDEVAELEGSFIDALGVGNVPGALSALLDLDSAIEARIRAGEDSLDLDNARSIFRALIARLGDVALVGARDPRRAVNAFVEALLELRARARSAGDWASADLIRDRLAAAGVEVRDERDGSTWQLTARDAQGAAGMPRATGESAIG